MNENRRKMFASLAHAKYRKKHGLFLVEGAHAVEELLKSDWKTEEILVCEPDRFPTVLARSGDIPVERVSRKDIDRIGTATTPQGIIAVACLPENNPDIIFRHDRILIADGLKDPSNMGSMIRTAVAFGFDGVITTPGTVDIFSPKVVRVTQGTLFAIDTAQRIDTARLCELLSQGHVVYALVTGGKTAIHSLKKGGRIALVIGGEIEGVSRPLLDVARYKVRIPISRDVDSLNAAIAAGIAMYLLGQENR